YAEVVIPVSLNSRKGGVVNNTVYFGNEEVPKEVVTILEKKPVKSVELKKIESRKIESKNIESENKRLKAELEKKELQIAELMKKLNEN
ncbi:MAG: hypothetical protein ACRC5F_07245, partial [Cetobacterium sp.]